MCDQGSELWAQKKLEGRGSASKSLGYSWIVLIWFVPYLAVCTSNHNYLLRNKFEICKRVRCSSQIPQVGRLWDLQTTSESQLDYFCSFQHPFTFRPSNRYNSLDFRSHGTESQGRVRLIALDIRMLHFPPITNPPPNRLNRCCIDYQILIRILHVNFPNYSILLGFRQPCHPPLK